MSIHVESMTVEDVLTSLGFANPLVAARQQAQMILLGRLTHYQTEVQQMEKKWGITLEEMAARYHAHDDEDFAVDDDYLQWRWYVEAVENIQSKLSVVA